MNKTSSSILVKKRLLLLIFNLFLFGSILRRFVKKLKSDFFILKSTLSRIISWVWIWLNLKKFLKSINTAKWNIYAISLQDLSFYTISYLNVFYNYKETGKSSEIYNSILNKEL